MASDKITASWLFGTFKTAGHWDAKVKKSVKWHVRFNHYITWCGLFLERVEIRDWRSGPPDGPICVICERYFARSSGLGAARTSRLVSQERTVR